MRSHALYRHGRYEEAAESLLRLPRPSVRQCGRLVATHAKMREQNAALDALDRVAALSPEFDLLGTALRACEMDAAATQMMDGLRKALALRQ